MDIEENESAGTPTPSEKGKKSDLLPDVVQTKKMIKEYLNVFGPPKESPVMETIGDLANEDFTDADITMMMLVLGLAQQVKSLALNATVQNLTKMVQDRPAATLTTRKNDEKQEAGSEPKEKAGSMSYAQAVKNNNPEPGPKTPHKRNQKRKGSAGPTPPEKPMAKVAKGGEKKEVKDEPQGWKIAGPPKPRGAKATKRKMFATRMTAKPLADPAKEEAKIALSLADTLTRCECKSPVNMQVASNKVNGTITITTPPGTESAQYNKYFDKMTEALNGTLGEGEPKYMQFRRVPTDVSLMVHGIFYDTVPDNNVELDILIREQLMTAHKINLTSAKFLREEPRTKTPDKKATSIIIRLGEGDALKLEPCFLLMGKYKDARIMWHATPTTQCTRCWKYGHPRVGCKETLDICPVCSKNHREEDHRCQQTACNGYKRIIPGCCLMTPAKCLACGGSHSAKDKECPEKVRVKEEAQKNYDRRMAPLADRDMEDAQNETERS